MSTPTQKDNAKPSGSQPFQGTGTLSFLSNTIIALPPRTVGGIRDQVLKVKTCNCKRSGCLKLYCECFNGGITCNSACRCTGCFNVEFRGQFEKDNRTEMIQTILDRSQHAFRPKASNITASQRGQEARGMKAAMEPLHSHEKRAKKTKLGCNCRKSFCLKKYCECFQAQLYCMSTCRCQNCCNKIGNEKREKLIAKMKKREGEKESLAMAAFAVMGTENIEAPAVAKIGGVESKTVAMLSAAVHAAGVDPFLPASSYARPMLDEEGRVVSDISFGLVGRQEVGAVDNSISKQLKGEDSHAECSGPFLAFGSLPGRKTNLQSRLAAATNEVGQYHEVLKTAMADIDHMKEQYTPLPARGDHATADIEKTCNRILPAPVENKLNKDSIHKSRSAKRRYEKFAEKTVERIMNDLKVCKKKMKISQATKNIIQYSVDEALKKQVMSTNRAGFIASHGTLLCSQRMNDELSVHEYPQFPQDLLYCTEELPTYQKQVVPKQEEVNKDFCSLATQEIILLNELSRKIRERSVEFAELRMDKKKRDNQYCK